MRPPPTSCYAPGTTILARTDHQTLSQHAPGGHTRFIAAKEHTTTLCWKRTQVILPYYIAYYVPSWACGVPSCSSKVVSSQLSILRP